MSSGNLATTQGVVASIERDLRTAAKVNLMNVEDLPAAAEYIGHISTEEQKKHRSVGVADEFLPEAMRSNATVGPPVEYLVYHADTLARGAHNRLDEDAPYLLSLRHAWADNIRAAFDSLPTAPATSASDANVRHLPQGHGPSGSEGP